MFQNQYIKVVLPLAVPQLYTYEVPAEFIDEIVIGKRVEVQFGKRRLYAAIIHSLCEKPEQVSFIKPILSVLDDAPIIQLWQLEFWKWIAHYYMCTVGEVMNAALPSAFKLSSESTFLKNPDAEYDESKLSGDEFMITEAFDFQEELSLQEIQQIVSKNSVIKLIRGLIDQQIIYIKESLKQKYKVKTKAFVKLTKEYNQEDNLRELLDSLVRANKQLAIVLTFLDLKTEENDVIGKSELLKKSEASAASLKTLVNKGVFEIEYLEIDRLEDDANELMDNLLNELQKLAFQNIEKQFETKPTILLHGITSSGKTHVYVELIKKVVKSGQQVLFLLPEIALTAQLIQRLRRWLGDVGIYHSKFNDAERIEIWNKVQQGKYKIIVGARSAMFLPFQSLGLIVADEEHDTSYKQYDPAPRYQARDSAIYLAHIHKAKVLLGSATPSFETYYNALKNKFGLVEIKERFGGVQPPQIHLADLKEARKRKQMIGALTPQLRDKMAETLDKKGQIILFQNRRGYAPYLTCNNCAWIPYCKNCDVSLTYHKFTEDLRCHYCGYREALIHQCRECKAPQMELRGMGTERIEDDLKLVFPDAKVARMDYDTVKSKHGHEKIIHRLEVGDIDILVGTQMVTKGLDFDNVKLVGVLNADALLYYPDFRAVERAYQMLMQVSGRAGRKNERGQVIIQMSDITHPITEYLFHENGYQMIFNKDMLERQAYRYPPYVRLVKIKLKHRDYTIVEKGGQQLAMKLREKWGKRIIGPTKPVISKIKMLYIREVTLKIERNLNKIEALKADIKKVSDDLYQYQEYKSLRIQVDVDAY